MEKLHKEGSRNMVIACIIGVQAVFSICMAIQNATYREMNTDLRVDLRLAKEERLSSWHTKNRAERDMQRAMREKAELEKALSGDLVE